MSKSAQTLAVDGAGAGDVYVRWGGESDCIRIAFEPDTLGESIFEAGRGSHRDNGSAVFYLSAGEAHELSAALSKAAADG